MIYIVNGAPGVGKTTFEDMVCSVVGENTYGYKLSTIDFVKEIATTCGWDGEKTLKNRKFLSDLKTLLTEWDDIPIQKLRKKIYLIRHEFEYFGVDFSSTAIFIDCREPKEIDRLCKMFNAQSLLIRKPNDTNIETSNSSDANIFDYNYDITINNDGTIYDLAQKAIDFVDQEQLHKRKKEYSVNFFGEII